MIVNSQQYGDMQAGNRGSRSEKLDIFSNILIASITKNVDKTVLDPDCLRMSIKHIEVFDEDKIQASICKKNDFFNVDDFCAEIAHSRYWSWLKYWGSGQDEGKKFLQIIFFITKCFVQSQQNIIIGSEFF